ncbi:MAG: lipopolysaccharide biosynthesis protein [Pseudomonadota bacterium]
MTQVSRSKLLKGAGWVSAATIAVNSLGILSTIILARLLVPEDFGLVAIATALVGIVGVLTEFSLTQALIQHKNPSDEHYHTAWTMNVIRALVVGSIIAALGYPLSSFYEDSRLVEILWLLGFITVIGGFANPKMVVFKRALSFRQAFIVKSCSKIAGFVTVVSIAWIYKSYWALILGSLATEAAVLILTYVLKPFRPRLSLARYKELLSFSIWLTLGQWVQAVNWRSQPLLYGYLLPTGVLGQLSLSSRMVGRTIDQATSPIKAMLFPAFSRLQNEKERMRLGYIRSQGTICLITFPIAAGFAVLAEEIVQLVIGEQWLPAVPLMQMIALTRIFQTTQNLGSVALATANTKKLFHRDLRAFLIRWPLIIAGLYLGHRFGEGDPYWMLLGGMSGQMLTVAINAVLNMRLLAKISPITLSDHWSFLWRPSLAVGGMYAAVHFAGRYLPMASDSFTKAAMVVSLIALGAVIYLLVLYALWLAGGRRETIEKECAEILRDVIAKGFGKLSMGRS